MSKQSIFIIVGILLAAGVIIGVLLTRQGHHMEGMENASEQIQVDTINRTIAPDFTLPDANGKNVTLSSFRGKNVVLFFSGGIACLPCLVQVVEFSRDPRLNGGDIVAFSIIPDSRQDWQQVKKELSFPSGSGILLDEGGKIFQMYNTLNFSSLMQEGSHAAHTYFIVDKDGAIGYVLDDPNMGTRNDPLVNLIQTGRFDSNAITERK